MTASASSNGLPVLDKYELLEEIGHGGMATVYRARDVRLDREVAVKLIHKHLRDNPEVRRRFGSEAKAVAKLRHPGIVEVYDVSDEDDVERFLVVELVRGTTLRDLLQRCAALPAEIGAALVLRLCAAVEHAHQCGVIHRDIKPENVLIELSAQRSGQVRSDGESGDDAHDPMSGAAADSRRPSGDVPRARIKLTDFGIAKILDGKGVTSTGQILGSPAHMAPEQIEGGEVGRFTDVFALGVLFYESVVGHLPFEGKNPAQVLRRVLDCAFDPADGERPQVGGRWAAIIAAALAREPADRIQTAAGLADRIVTELRAVGIDDPDGELARFMDDPAGYESALAAMLVPRLIARGEAERRRGRIRDAAADFNRALAFEPDNLGILRRVSALGAYGRWQRRAYRLALILAASVTLGFCAFGLTRWLHRSPGAGTWALAPRPATSAQNGVEPNGVGATARPTATAAASRQRIHIEPRLVASRRIPVAPPEQPRRVQFSLIPKGAVLTLDGRDVGSPFGETFELAPGPHSVRVQVVGSKCCKPLETTATVTPAPADDPSKVQVLVFSLERRPSTVSLVGGPVNAQFACPAIGVSGTPGTVATTTLPEVQWTGSCEFNPGGKRKTVVLLAGEHNAVAWPAD